MAPHEGVAGHMGYPPLGTLLFLGFTPRSLWKDFIHVHFGFFVKLPYPLGISYK